MRRTPVCAVAVDFLDNHDSGTKESIPLYVQNGGGYSELDAEKRAADGHGNHTMDECLKTLEALCPPGRIPWNRVQLYRVCCTSSRTHFQYSSLLYSSRVDSGCLERRTNIGRPSPQVAERGPMLMALMDGLSTFTAVLVGQGRRSSARLSQSTAWSIM
eukprot:COSAG02_NODE_3094_length_7380_cov_2.503089_9_plen_159_part_00